MTNPGTVCPARRKAVSDNNVHLGAPAVSHCLFSLPFAIVTRPQLLFHCLQNSLCTLAYSIHSSCWPQDKCSALFSEGLSPPRRDRYEAAASPRSTSTPLTMFRTLAKSQLLTSHTQASKVSVLGGAGGIGQPLSLLMKLNPRVTELALYDIKGGPGSQSSIMCTNRSSQIARCRRRYQSYQYQEHSEGLPARRQWPEGMSYGLRYCLDPSRRP